MPAPRIVVISERVRRAMKRHGLPADPVVIERTAAAIIAEPEDLSPPFTAQQENVNARRIALLCAWENRR